jgi:hypothetical protein
MSVKVTAGSDQPVGKRCINVCRHDEGDTPSGCSLSAQRFAV